MKRTYTNAESYTNFSQYLNVSSKEKTARTHNTYPTENGFKLADVKQYFQRSGTAVHSVMNWLINTEESGTLFWSWIRCRILWRRKLRRTPRFVKKMPDVWNAQISHRVTMLFQRFIDSFAAIVSHKFLSWKHSNDWFMINGTSVHIYIHSICVYIIWCKYYYYHQHNLHTTDLVQGHYAVFTSPVRNAYYRVAATLAACAHVGTMIPGKSIEMTERPLTSRKKPKCCYPPITFGLRIIL